MLTAKNSAADLAFLQVSFRPTLSDLIENHASFKTLTLISGIQKQIKVSSMDLGMYLRGGISFNMQVQINLDFV